MEPYVPSDAHRRQRVVRPPGVLVDTGARDAQQTRHLLGREQRLSERQRRELIGHDREPKRAARRNSGADRNDESVMGCRKRFADAGTRAPGASFVQLNRRTASAWQRAGTRQAFVAAGARASGSVAVDGDN